MEREHFVKVIGEVLDSLPEEFRERINNLAILVEDEPPRRFRKKPWGTGTRGSSSCARRSLSAQRTHTFSRAVFVEADSSCSSAADDHTYYAGNPQPRVFGGPWEVCWSEAGNPLGS